MPIVVPFNIIPAPRTNAFFHLGTIPIFFSFEKGIWRLSPRTGPNRQLKNNPYGEIP